MVGIVSVATSNIEVFMQKEYEENVLKLSLEGPHISLEVDIDFLFCVFLYCSCILRDVSRSIDWLYLLSNRLG